MFKFILAAVVACASCASTPAPAAPQPVQIPLISLTVNSNNCDVAELSQSKSHLIVKILVDDGHGTGIILNKKGDVLTSSHVSARTKKITIGSHAYKITKDLGPMSVSVLSPITPFTFESAEKLSYSSLELGESLFTMGFPGPHGLTLSTGTFSEEFNLDGVYLSRSMMNVYGGHSGSPVFNCDGKFAGVILGVDAESTGISFFNSGAPIKEIIQEYSR